MAAKGDKVIGVLAVLRGLGPDARLFISAMALTRLTGFMVFPFLTVILNERLGASIVAIGTLFTVGAFVGLATSPIAGFVADAVRKKTMMLVGAALTLICFLALALFQNLTVYYIAITLFSVAGGMLEPLLRSSLGDFAQDEAQRPALFHVRYYIVNIAGAVGPFIGLWFMYMESVAVFYLAAGSYAFLMVVIQRKLREPHEPATSSRRGAARAVLRELLGHRMFVALFIANFLLVLVYAQTDEPLIFHMIDRGLPDVAQLITLMTVTNTVVVLVLHGVMMERIMAMGEQKAFVIAIICLGLALVLIALNGSYLRWVWVLAIAISTLGEIIALPMFLTIVDRIAPPDQRNTFFGVYMLSNTGGALAPFFAALVIQHLGGTVLFVGAAACCLPLAVIGMLALRNDTTLQEETRHEPV